MNIKEILNTNFITENYDIENGKIIIEVKTDNEKILNYVDNLVKNNAFIDIFTNVFNIDGYKYFIDTDNYVYNIINSLRTIYNIECKDIEIKSLIDFKIDRIIDFYNHTLFKKLVEKAYLEQITDKMIEFLKANKQLITIVKKISIIELENNKYMIDINDYKLNNFKLNIKSIKEI